MQRHVPRPLDDRLDAALPGAVHELRDDRQLGYLRRVVRVGERARPQTVAQAQRHVVLGDDLEQVVVPLVERILARRCRTSTPSGTTRRG